VAVFAAAALIAVSLTVVATNQSGRAEREARIATARELAAAAVANLEADPERSVLLATEAVALTRSVDGSTIPEAEEALHRAVVASRLVMSVPGMGGLLDWSPTGAFVTEGVPDSGIIDIRDGQTGQSVLSFEGHDGDVNDVAFSPDGSMLASTGDDGKLKVWDSSAGRLLASASGNGAVFGPSFSADGSLVAAAWHDGFPARPSWTAHGPRSGLWFDVLSITPQSRRETPAVASLAGRQCSSRDCDVARTRNHSDVLLQHGGAS
jgi:hypothetical protein